MQKSGHKAFLCLFVRIPKGKIIFIGSEQWCVCFPNDTQISSTPCTPPFSGVTVTMPGAFAIFCRVGIHRGRLCLLLHGRLYEIEFGGLPLLCCKMLNLDSSHFNIPVNKLLEYIFTKVQTWVRKFCAGTFQSLTQRGRYEIAILC